MNFTLKVKTKRGAKKIISQAKFSHKNGDGPPPPPPPLPPIQTETEIRQIIPLKRGDSIKSTKSTKSTMQDELSVVLSMFKDKRTDLDIRATPEVFINQKSNPDEVQNWLKAKEFSVAICGRFKNISGHEILQTNRTQCEAICGQSEGRRLFSQLQIQKSVCGFQTVRSSELRAILARAREKIEITD